MTILEGFFALARLFQYLKSRAPIDLVFRFGTASASTISGGLRFAIANSSQAATFYSLEIK